jgi:hypothetical protein
MEHAFHAIGNIVKGWQQIKGCHWKDDQQAKNVIIPMILSDSISSIHKSGLLIGIPHRNFTIGVVRIMYLELCTNNALWAIGGKLKKKDALFPEVHDVVVQFYGMKITKLVQIKEMSLRRELALKSGKHMQPIFLQNPR